MMDRGHGATANSVPLLQNRAPQSSGPPAATEWRLPIVKKLDSDKNHTLIFVNSVMAADDAFCEGVMQLTASVQAAE